MSAASPVRVATPEESSALIRAACVEVVLSAERARRQLQDVAHCCRRRYGPGAFSVHFASMTEAAAGRCLSLDDWLGGCVRRSELYPLDSDRDVPPKVLDAARAFSCECAAEGQLGSRVIYRTASKLLEQMPVDGCHESRDALALCDTATEVCICCEVPAGDASEVFCVVARLSLETLVQKQQEQQQKWDMTREHVVRMKAWGNEELQNEVEVSDLASQTYREALRILLESQMEDYELELSLRLNLAEASARSLRWSDSASECERALVLQPSNPKALFRYGRALLRLDKAPEARAVLMKAARAAPTDRLVREELEAAKRWKASSSALCSPSSPPRANSGYALHLAHTFMKQILATVPKLWTSLRLQVLVIVLGAVLLGGASSFRLWHKGRHPINRTARAPA